MGAKPRLQSSDLLKHLTRGNWRIRPPAHPGQLESAANAVPQQLPHGYLEFLRVSNGGEGPLRGLEHLGAFNPGWICMARAEEAGQGGRQWPGAWFEFATSGAGLAYLFCLGQEGVWLIDQTEGPSEAIEVFSDFARLVANLGDRTK